MRRTPLLGAAASLLLAFGAAACGGNKSESKADLVDDLSRSLQAGANGLDEETADCIAGAVVDDVGFDALKDVDLSADEPPEELQDEITAAAARASDECNVSGTSG